jgi:UDP-N-acetylglucosamine 2-epimerase (non-hydrolysing)
MSKRIAFVFGTRPEAIKMAPLIKAVGKSQHYDTVVILTGQHPTMATQVLEWFGIEPDFIHYIDRANPTLSSMTAQILHQVNDTLLEVQPDLVVVQGDTASAFAGAIAAFNLQIPIAHLEAGLRTTDIYSPYPEEAYRQMISRISELHFCPTDLNRSNLLKEGIPISKIMITGNTVVDAFSVVTSKIDSSEIHVRLPEGIPSGDLVLVTAHRRENLGAGMSEIARSVKNLSSAFPNLTFVFPMHPNPAVRAKLIPELADICNVKLIEPLEYPEFISILAKSTLVLTDSGGVQEEAPILGIPAIVMRENTERPEGISAGGVILVGANETRITDAISKVLSDETILESMSRASNPYGDGLASSRCLSMLDEFFGFGKRSLEFENAI